MKLFLDTADIRAIKEWRDTGLIDGVTTNPSHLSKEGGDPKKRVLEILELLPKGEISIEVTEKEPDAVYKQAKAIAHLNAHVLVKIPCAQMYYPVIARLVAEGVKINITLVFTVTQGILMAKLGVQYISPFVGRLDDNDNDGITLLHRLRHVIDFYGYDTHILAASLRTVHHVREALMAHADAITLPPTLLAQATRHVLTDQGIALFDSDWQQLGIDIFP